MGNTKFHPVLSPLTQREPFSDSSSVIHHVNCVTSCFYFSHKNELNFSYSKVIIKMNERLQLSETGGQT